MNGNVLKTVHVTASLGRCCFKADEPDPTAGCNTTEMTDKMTHSHTPESAARVILDMFQSHNARPGEAVLPGALGQLTVVGVLPSDGVDDGLGHGLAQGWFVNGPNGAVRLTKAGFVGM